MWKYFFGNLDLYEDLAQYQSILKNHDQSIYLLVSNNQKWFIVGYLSIFHLKELLKEVATNECLYIKKSFFEFTAYH